MCIHLLRDARLFRLFAMPLLLLAACQTPGDRLRGLSSELLVCPEQPALESIDEDRTFAAWMIDVAAAGQACRDKLAAVRSVLTK